MCGKAVFLIVILLWLMPSTVAQDGGTATPQPSNMIVHVVQRDETLYQIALRYGTTVEAIMTANNINDPLFIDVGQRLLITASVGMPSQKHIVELGESLYTLAIKYRTTANYLASLNDLIHPERLFVGQILIIESVPTQEMGGYVVQPNDTWLSIATRFGVVYTDLQSVNGISANSPIFEGQLLLIPKQPTPSQLLKFSAPILDLKLIPIAAIQGQSIGLQFQTNGKIHASGVFMGLPFQVAMIDDTHYASVLAVHAFTEPSVYSLQLVLTDSEGKMSRHEFRLTVSDGNYASEAIDFPPELQNLLVGEVVQAELEKVSDVMTGFTPQKYFEGLMGLPVAGPITSQFGTRRSYNGSPYNTFHGGTDFGGAIGIPIMAPAAGVIVLAETLNVRGNAIIIDHGWGVYTGYWHQSELYVQTGQVVNKGDIIGSLGATGLVTGPHLHWEMWVNGIQVDPMQWVQQAFP